MKKLHSLAFYALVTPTIALGAGSVMAEKAADGKRLGAQTYQQDAAQSGMQTQRYISAVPAEGRQVSELMGVNVRTSDKENIGSVNDLIVNKDGQVVAVVVGVGGFLGMGEKDVAISWDSVTQTGTANERELRIDATREELSSAPEFKKQD
ncbi:PRC-barrel domain-containing protein [Marinobacter sp.]|uniref:PRC-barrel domain-containing protein n=1 Tax=Marinobacter sp. TaxID=50741 RepID=UPI0019E9A295|nr:PRC-barrel domain-containing protein [Marinobacter sp.]MBE0486820.1 PRC-barrel domain-containing protein [Marinobacter sp.]